MVYRCTPAGCSAAPQLTRSEKRGLVPSVTESTFYAVENIHEL
jgi:hypothetical protein